MRDATAPRLAEFDRWLHAQHYAEPTVRAYLEYSRRAALCVLTEFELPLRRAQLEHLEHFWRSLPASQSSREQGRKALVAFFVWAGRRPSPASGIPVIPRRRGKPRPLPLSEHLQLLKAAHRLGGESELIALVWATSGCRFSELHRARWHQFDLAGEPPSWTIEGKGSGRRGPKRRVVPLHPEALQLLRKHKLRAESADYLFPARGASSRPHVSSTVLRRLFREVADEAGLVGVVPHRLRHTVGTQGLRRSGNLRVVQELLGHEDVRTTQEYTAVDLEEIAAVVDELPA